MSTALHAPRVRRTLGYHLGTVALWTGFLGFTGFLLVIFVPAC